MVTRWELIALVLCSVSGLAFGLEFQDQIVGDKMPGWTVRGKAADVWEVKDGVLHCKGGKQKGAEWLLSDRDYTDVVIEFDYKLSPGGNSGVCFRQPRGAEERPSLVSFEIQLLDDEAGKHRKLQPAQFNGSVYKLVAPSKRAAKPVGEWNHMRITADGDRIVVVLNDEAVVDADGRECPEILKRSTVGSIGFQDHLTPVWFRNIRVADLAKDRAERSAWWRDAKFGLFIHWGVYSVLGQGEWNMQVSKIPAAEYEKLPPQFNPTGFDAAQWVSLAKRAGQKYIVITSKHHDGFAMYDSKVSSYDMMDATPFKRDPIKELSEECRQQGVRFGLYHSVLDWHHPAYAPIPDWDPARKEIKPDFDKYLVDMSGQVRELCTGYGPLACWWWDGGWDHNDPAGRKQLAAVNAMIRELQPGILINNRACNGEDFDTPEQFIPPTGLTNKDGTPKLWESCITLTTGHGSHAPNAWWGYDKNEKEFKTAEYSIRMLVDVVSKGGNLLLNVGPSPEGLIGKAETEVLETMGRWLDINGEAIYGTTASAFKYLPFFGRTTVKGNMLYVHVFDWPADRQIVLPGLTNEVRGVRLLAKSPTTLTSSRKGSNVVIPLPETAPDKIASVIAVELDDAPKVEPFTIRPEADGSISLPATFAEIRSKHGQRARFESTGGEVFVTNWNKDFDTVYWQFELEKAGKYELTLDYAADQPSAGADFEIAVGPVTTTGMTTSQPAGAPGSQGPALKGTVEATGGDKQFKPHVIGIVELKTGTNSVLVRPLKLAANGPGLMNLRQATLALKN